MVTLRTAMKVGASFAISLIGGTALAGSANFPLNGTYISSNSAICNDAVNPANANVGAKQVSFAPANNLTYEAWLATIASYPIPCETPESTSCSKYLRFRKNPITPSQTSLESLGFHGTLLGNAFETVVQYGQMTVGLGQSANIAINSTNDAFVNSTVNQGAYFIVTSYQTPTIPSVTAYLLYQFFADPNSQLYNMGWQQATAVFDTVRPQATTAVGIGIGFTGCNIQVRFDR